MKPLVLIPSGESDADFTYASWPRLAARMLREKGLEEARVSPRLQAAYLEELRSTGVAVEIDRELFKAERRHKSSLGLEQLTVDLDGDPGGAQLLEVGGLQPRRHPCLLEALLPQHPGGQAGPRRVREVRVRLAAWNENEWFHVLLLV